MRLADFLMQDMALILARWEEFAATCGAAGARMKSVERRDHARQILEAVAADLRTPQTAEAQADKSMGLAPMPARQTAAQTHAILRAKSGFDIKQLAAEYRALRASVLDLWMSAYPPERNSFTDIVRFNEAIDQALAESIGHFHSQVEQARYLLLGIVGHDMRSPLQTIQMTARHLTKLNAGVAVSEAARRLITSGQRIQGLMDDLVDYSRASLDLGIVAVMSDVDLAKLCAEELEDLRAANPGTHLELSVTGDARGSWDGKRLRQMICNLVVNAIKHGSPDQPVRTTIVGDEAGVRIEVANAGPGIDPVLLSEMFEPWKRGVADTGQQDGLGLGLYIVREIAKAHGGAVEARSDDGETVFTVSLPRSGGRDLSATPTVPAPC